MTRLILKQESIPVGCKPPGLHRTGVSLTETPLDRDPSPPRQSPLVPCPFWGVGYWGYPAVRYWGQGRVSEGRIYRHPNYKNGKYASYWNALLFAHENNATPKEKDAFIAIRKILNCVNLSGLQDEQITLQKTTYLDCAHADHTAHCINVTHLPFPLSSFSVVHQHTTNLGSCLS